MTADLYQQAKVVFAELLELTESQRRHRLDTLQADSPELVKEIRSLLDFHTAQSLIVPPISPKIRTRSTLSTTFHARSLKWLRGPLQGLLIALPLFALSGIATLLAEASMRRSLKNSVAHHLSEAIDFRVKEFRLWERQELDRAISWSRHPLVNQAIEELVDAGRSLSPEGPELAEFLKNSDCASKLQQQLAELAGVPVKFAVWDRRMITLADWNQDACPDLIGQGLTNGGARLLAPAMKGNAKLYLPDLSLPITEGFVLEHDQPAASIVLPVLSSKNGSVLAALMVRGYGLDERFFAMLERWTAESHGGEVYMLTGRGGLLTRSRYDEVLNTLPLSYDKTGAKRQLLIRDPGVYLLSGKTSKESSAAWPPTLLARQVTAGDNGFYVDGYRNYVGQTVIGAWRWLPEHEVGIALEEDYATAFTDASTFRNALFGISSLFTLGLIGFAAASVLRDRERRFRSNSEVGPYQIQELLGEGGMGKVYLAEHSLLCRQSAIKVLTKGDNDLSVISRFEREVQLASQLTHPNTITIYDFGRSREGVFYYAMEYINGAHLGQLIEFAGPLAPGRVIYILRQLTRALSEAHSAGVVHRDIKPQNIMVCNRGGEPDFVKLFDYGLVKAFVPGVSLDPSQTKVVVGTPRFMAPERLASPWLADPRVDVYSVGALAYYLLTAQLPPLVTAAEEIEYDQPGVETLDLPAGVVDFGGILSVCMSVEPALRPSSMGSLLRELDILAKKFPWSREDSEDWWGDHEGKLLRLVHSRRKHLGTRNDNFWKK